MHNLENVLNNLSHGFKFSELKSAYDQLSLAYRSGSKIKLTQPLQCMAYAYARMPTTVAVLEEVLKHLTPHQEKVGSLLDLGSGPGSVLWATKKMLPSIRSAICLDQSKPLLQFSQQLIDASDMHIQATWQTYDLQSHAINSVLKAGQAYDLVTLSYVLNELNTPDIKKVIEMSWEKTTSFLVIVEPGTPKGFGNIKICRDHLTQKGAHIVAPCTHINACPMQDSDWCHFNVRLARSKTHQSIKGTLSYEDEKYSYLILSKQPTATRGSRIVKKPNQAKGLIELDLCSEKGLTRQRISKRQNETYKAAKKSQWGDLWDFIDPK